MSNHPVKPLWKRIHSLFKWICKTNSLANAQNTTYQPEKSRRTHDLSELWEWRSFRSPQRPHNFPEYQEVTLTVNMVTPISISSSDSIPASLLRITMTSVLSWFTPDVRDTPDGKVRGRDTNFPFTCGGRGEGELVVTTFGTFLYMFWVIKILSGVIPSLCHPI